MIHIIVVDDSGQWGGSCFNFHKTRWVEQVLMEVGKKTHRLLRVK